MQKEVTKKPPTAVTSDHQELEHQIRLRAYELYEARDKKDGHEVEDWLHAEEEIREKKVQATAAAA